MFTRMAENTNEIFCTKCLMVEKHFYAEPLLNIYFKYYVRIALETF